MKRLVLLAAALGVTSSAHAADDVEFKQSGEFRVRYENFINNTAVKDAKDGESHFNHRFKYNVTARKGETLQAFLGVLNAATWGYADDASGTPAGTTTPGTPSAGTADDSLIVYRAWGWWKATDMLNFKFGRFGMEVADGAVFSENDWEQVPVAHEGVLGAWDANFAKIAIFGIKTDEFTDTATLSNDPERNLYGLNIDFKNMPEAIKMANLHFVQEVRDETATPNAGSINAQRFGLTVGGDASNILYKATAAFVTGKQKERVGAQVSTDINSMMYDLMLGYQMPEVMGLKLTAGYHYDTGDKNAADTKNEQYDAFYYDRHNYGGLMDVFRWGNLNYWNVNASMMPSEDIEAGVGYYMFSRTEAAGTTTFGENFAGAGIASTNKDLGSEIDVYANKAYENGFKVGARYGAFLPGKALESATVKTETAHEVFLQTSMSF